MLELQSQASRLRGCSGWRSGTLVFAGRLRSANAFQWLML